MCTVPCFSFQRSCVSTLWFSHAGLSYQTQFITVMATGVINSQFDLLGAENFQVLQNPAFCFAISRGLCVRKES